MDLYFLFFLVGAVGLVLMAVMGAAGGHSGHAHGSHSASTSAHAGHGGHAANGHAGHSAHHGHAHGVSAQGFNLRAAIMGWLSPRVLLTLSMGTGAAGVALASVLPHEPWRALVSVSAGVALEKLVVAPMWGMLARFASKPARTLDSAVMEEATALAGFDAQGYGLVSIVLDGHEMRLLARLSPEHERDAVRSGDKLLVESVDGARGRCVVSPLRRLTL